MDAAEARVKGFRQNYVIIADSTYPRRFQSVASQKHSFFRSVTMNDKGSTSRETPVQKFGHEVHFGCRQRRCKSARLLRFSRGLFVLVHAAPEQTQTEMGQLAEGNFPECEVLH